MLKGKEVQIVTVTDPDSGLPVEVAIIKLSSGGMIGVDASFFQQDKPIFSPFDKGVRVVLKDEDDIEELSFNHTDLTPEQVVAYLGKKGIVCPFCGSHDIEGTGSQNIEGDTSTNEIMCIACEAKWDDVYTLMDIDVKEQPA